MDQQDSFMARLIRTFIDHGFIAKSGQSSWSLALPGGVPVVDLAISILGTVASLGLSALLSRIGIRLDEGNVIVRTVFDVLATLGNMPFDTILTLIGRAIGFLQNLIGMGSRLFSRSSHTKRICN